MEKPIKVKFGVYVKNNSDGSASALFFRSADTAEQFARGDDERFCEDIQNVELEFDLNGNLLTPEPE